jgi:glycosyltransferase involved in cell wall biosynthesis
MTRDRIDVVYAVTASISLVHLKGQLGYLRTLGLHPAALCSPGVEVSEATLAEGIPIFTVEMAREISPFRDLLSLFRIWRTLRTTRPLVCNVGTPKAGLLVGLAAWLNRVPCRIYTLHGLRLETTTGLKRFVLHITERIACRCAHRVICVSPSLRRRAIELGIVSAGRARMLASGSCNGVNPSRFAPTPERFQKAAEIRSSLGIQPDQPVLGFAGRFTRDKGIPELMDAFQMLQRRFPNAVLLLVGCDEPGDPVSSETRAAMDSNPGVRIVPFTSDIAPYYLAMDVFVLPTHREGFPITVLEAQAAERPVVTTNATGAVDSIVDGVTGLLVPVADSASLASALERLIGNRTLAAELGRNGLKRVLREFTQPRVWEALADEYVDLGRQAGLTLLEHRPVG